MAHEARDRKEAGFVVLPPDGPPQGKRRLSEGERVEAGAELGRCGNSGNTSEPRLHFHLQDGPRLGLPAQFLNYAANGKPVDRGEPAKGKTIRPLE
ncbi:hypothetical protein [Verticiella sediminum]|uniref:hypothetical protein n=1 Tax=Verticiella sediminum TaxID=1247510 RepID=UPI001478D9BA|nr:hypothetical protein [Verticiella sediminum]